MRDSPPSLSVLVPVYNTAPYLPRCAQSVLTQTFRDFELILVDDGSTDDSGILCDEIAEADARVRVIHRPNGGLAAARNTGLAAALGDYVLFLDADDFYTATSVFQRLMDTARAGSHDTVCFGYARYYGRRTAHGSKSVLRPALSLDGLPGAAASDTDISSLLNTMVKRNAWQSSACIRLVRRDLLGTAPFPTGTACEDIEPAAALLLRVHSVGVVGAPLPPYAYRVREGSLSRSLTPKVVADQLAVIERLAKAKQIPESRKNAYYGYAAFQYCTLMLNWQLCRPAPDPALKTRARALAWLLRYDACPIVKAARLSHRVLGFSLTGKLMRSFRS